MKPVHSLSAFIKHEFAEFKTLHANTIIRYTSVLTLILILVSLIILGLSWNKLPTEVPLWYSKPWGNDRLANPLWLLLLPGASFFWYIVNGLLCLHVTKEHLVFSQILFLSSLLGSIFSCVTLSMIVWIIS